MTRSDNDSQNNFRCATMLGSVMNLFLSGFALVSLVYGGTLGLNGTSMLFTLIFVYEFFEGKHGNSYVWLARWIAPVSRGFWIVFGIVGLAMIGVMRMDPFATVLLRILFAMSILGNALALPFDIAVIASKKYRAKIYKTTG